MRYAIILALILAGCYDEKHQVTSSDDYKYTITCLDGVEYYVSARHLAPRFNRWGKVMLCSDTSSGLVDPEFQPQTWSNI